MGVVGTPGGWSAVDRWDMANQGIYPEEAVHRSGAGVLMSHILDVYESR